MRVSLAGLVFAAGVLAAQEYAGNDTCSACHDELAKTFRRSRHQAIEKEKKRGWEGRTCESCHGPGAKHAESADITLIINPAKLPAPKENAACLQCHVNQRVPGGRIDAGHAGGEVACSSCHTIHAKPGQPLVARRKPEVNALCGGCHRNAPAAFRQPHTHPLAQGAMSCTDCHNPHGAPGAAAQRVSFGNEPSCLSCHSNLRGPFAFEHAPVRLEGCSACHVPHGSANPKMLARAEVRTVCLECHSNLGAITGGGGLGGVPSAFHDIRNPRIQACSTCHRKIHGSHVDRSLQR